MAEETKKPEGPTFAIQRVYLRDMSFESPSAPEVFREKWQPDINLDLRTKARTIEKDVHEVILGLTVTVKHGDKTAFVVEIEQAGIFTINGFEDEKLAHLLGSICPNIIYPFARETIADAVTRGGFPQLLLAPVNFEALYQQHLEQKDKEKKHSVKMEQAEKQAS